MIKMHRAFALVGAAAMLAVLVNGLAVAATGNGFVLGQRNRAADVTALTRTTPGPALKVQTRSAGNAPFVVNGRGRVANLNADKVDGLDAARLRHTIEVFEVSPTGFTGSSFRIQLPLARGRWAATYTATFDGVSGYTFCWFEQVTRPGAPDQQTRILGESIYEGSNLAGLNGSGVITLATDTVVHLTCQTDGAALEWRDSQPVLVQALKIDAGSTQVLSLE